VNDTPIAGLTQAPADMLLQSADQLQSRFRALGTGKTPQHTRELEKACREFESLFVAYMLKVMRETIEEAGLGEGDGLGKGIYTDLFDQELSRSIANQGALGISDLLIRRLTPQATPPSEAQPDAGPSPRSDSSLPPRHSGSGDEEDATASIPDFRLPISARLSSDYGLRKDPFTRQTRFHKGIDLAAPAGMPVQAACSGEVVYAGYEKGYGNTVVLQHPQGFETRYAHLGALNVKVGESVAEQQILGSVGSTGRSTGPHLHFEVMRFGKAIDPELALAD